MRVKRYRGQNRLNTLLHVQSRSIDNEAIDVPWTVIALEDLGPCGQPVARDIGDACLHATPVLVDVGSRDLLADAGQSAEHDQHLASLSTSATESLSAIDADIATGMRLAAQAFCCGCGGAHYRSRP